jgi:protease I
MGIFSEKDETKPMGLLQGRRIAILATNGFEQAELFDPKHALDEAGALVKVVSPRDGEIRAWNKTDWGKSIKVDLSLEEAEAADFDALVLPGGVMNPDKLRMNERAVEFVRHFVTSGKPIAAICHGPWTLIEAGGVKGRTMTSYQSIKTDLINAGAHWVDQEVVVDNGWVTSRKPDDIPAFNKKMIEEFREGAHDPQKGKFPQTEKSPTDRNAHH